MPSQRREGKRTKRGLYRPENGTKTIGIQRLTVRNRFPAIFSHIHFGKKKNFFGSYCLQDRKSFAGHWRTFPRMKGNGMFFFLRQKVCCTRKLLSGGSTTVRTIALSSSISLMQDTELLISQLYIYIYIYILLMNKLDNKMIYFVIRDYETDNFHSMIICKVLYEYIRFHCMHNIIIIILIPHTY